MSSAYTHRGAAHAHVHRARRGGGQLERGARRGVVRRHEHAHVGQDAHERHVLEHLVAAPVGAHRHAGMRGAYLHVQVAVAHRVADLVVGAARAEHGEGTREGDVARERQPGGHIDHVLLGDAAVEQALRVFGRGGGEGGRGGGAGEVGIDGHDGHAGIGQFGERRAEGGTRGLLRLRERRVGKLDGGSGVSHGRPPSRRRPPVRRAQPPAVRRWAPCHATLPGLP